jgi:hypothetical protein
MLRLPFLQPQGSRLTAVEIAGINLVGDSQCFGRHGQLICASWCADEHRRAQQNRRNVRNRSSAPHNLTMRLPCFSLCAERV